MSNGQHGWSVQTIAYMPVRDRGCWMAVGQIRTPGNLGALMRTACAAGADGFFFLGDGADAFHPQAVRASTGAIFGLPLVRTNATHLRRWTQKHGIEVIGASPDGDVSFNRATYGARVMLMIGEERRGLTAEQRTLCDQLVRIPMQDNLDSLNAAVAGSLLLYEVLRPASGQMKVEFDMAPGLFFIGNATMPTSTIPRSRRSLALREKDHGKSVANGGG